MDEEKELAELQHHFLLKKKHGASDRRLTNHESKILDY
jgi:hypothetical protein